jgi:hypothetical protein
MKDQIKDFKNLKLNKLTPNLVNFSFFLSNRDLIRFFLYSMVSLNPSKRIPDPEQFEESDGSVKGSFNGSQ